MNDFQIVVDCGDLGDVFGKERDQHVITAFLADSRKCGGEFRQFLLGQGREKFPQLVMAVIENLHQLIPRADGNPFRDVFQAAALIPEICGHFVKTITAGDEFLNRQCGFLGFW